MPSPRAVLRLLRRRAIPAAVLALAVAAALLSAHQMAGLLSDGGVGEASPGDRADGQLTLPFAAERRRVLAAAPAQRGGTDAAASPTSPAAASGSGAGSASSTADPAPRSADGRAGGDSGRVTGEDVRAGVAPADTPADAPAPAEAATAPGPATTAGHAPASAPAPAGAPKAVAAAAPLRMELKGLRRVEVAGESDQLELRVAAVAQEADPVDPARAFAVRVALPTAAVETPVSTSSLRVQIAMLDPEPAAETDESLALRVRVALSDARVEEPVLTRSEQAPEEASDRLDLWVPLGDVPAPPAQEDPSAPVDVVPSEGVPPGGAEEGSAAADTTVPVDVVVADAGDPTSHRLELPSADPPVGTPTDAPPAAIVVDVEVAPSEGATATEPSSAVAQSTDVEPAA